MSDHRSRIGQAPGEEGHDQALVDPTASAPADRDDDTAPPGDSGATDAAARELDTEDESEPTRSE